MEKSAKTEFLLIKFRGMFGFIYIQCKKCIDI